MKSMNLRHGALETIHVFIGLREISFAMGMRLDLLELTGILFRSVIIPLIS